MDKPPAGENGPESGAAPVASLLESVSVFSPAKINLSLAVTGRRPDGFHDLISVVAPLTFGDTLHAQLLSPDLGTMTLRCDAEGVPSDGTNLVLRAAAEFVAATGWRGGVRFTLEKRIPAGAGLGGGSSNAVAALRALQTLSGKGLPPDRLSGIAARLGSDCPLFLSGKPVLMRGRGELLAPLPTSAEARLRGRRVLVFKPRFGIATPWAFQALAARPDWYADAAASEASLAAWLADSSAPAETLLGNTLERPAFAKWVALPALLAWLRERHGVEARMSGSGSACFAFLAVGQNEAPLMATIREAWGEAAFVQITALA